MRIAQDRFVLRSLNEHLSANNYNKNPCMQYLKEVEDEALKIKSVII